MDNPKMYEMFHFGSLNVRGMYMENGQILQSIAIQLDLGVQVHSSLRIPAQVDSRVKKAYRMQ